MKATGKNAEFVGSFDAPKKSMTEQAIDAQRQWLATGCVPLEYLEAVLGGSFSSLTPLSELVRFRQAGAE